MVSGLKCYLYPEHFEDHERCKWCILVRRSLPCFHLISKVIAADFQDELAPETTLDFQTSFDLDLVFLQTADLLGN